MILKCGYHDNIVSSDSAELKGAFTISENVESWNTGGEKNRFQRSKSPTIVLTCMRLKIQGTLTAPMVYPTLCVCVCVRACVRECACVRAYACVCV